MLASYVPGELIPLPSSGSIPELPHVAKLDGKQLAEKIWQQSNPGTGAFESTLRIGAQS